MEQDLMKPRVKIIAPFPGMEFYYNMKVGDILTDPGGYKAVTNQNGDAIRAFDYSTFPNIFQLLPWYAEREAGMMPEYVKCVKLPAGITVDTKHIFIEGAITRITEWRKSKDSWVLDIFPLFFHFLYYGQFFTPATLTQYEQYIKNLKK